MVLRTWKRACRLRSVLRVAPESQDQRTADQVKTSLHAPLSHSLVPYSSTHLLPEAHDLETLEVVEVPPLGGLLTLLGVVAVVELLFDLLGLPLLPEGGGAGATGQLLEDEAGERQVRERSGLAGNDVLGVGGGTLNENLCCTR